MAPAPRLTIALLGPPAIEVDGLPFRVDTRKATAVLAYLAVTARPVSRDLLTGLLWPDTPPERARSALRRTLSTLRAALGDRWLVTDRDVVSLELDGVTLDLTELRRLLAECSAHGHAADESCKRCVPLLEGAVALDRGSFLQGFALRDSVEFEDWQQLTTEELRRDQATALERLAEALAAHGELPRSLTMASRRLALEPLHEPAHRQLIRLYAASGDRSAALQHYRECVRILDRELGVRPLDETTELYHAILDGTFAPTSAAVATVEPSTEDTDHGGSYELVGRTSESEALFSTLAGIERDGRIVALVGEAGIGKTRLGEEFLAHARKHGRLVVGVRCFPEETELAYGVVIELARSAIAAASGSTAGSWWREEAARVLPELGPPPPIALDSLAAQARFYDAICELLTDAVGGEEPGVLFIDDLHWADEASLGLMGYLVNRLRGRPLMLVVTWRNDEISARHPAPRLLADARRARTGRMLTLGRLSLDEVAELVRSTGRDDSLGERLHRETGGLPFFVVEYLDALARGSTDDAEWSVPGGVRDLLLARLSSLGELAGQVIAAAAVLGRSFDLETVRDTSGRADEEIVLAIEQLIASGLVSEGDDGTFDFRHEQSRNLVYVDMTLARRRLLHRRAAAALDSRGRRDEQAALIAHHLEVAGDDAAAADLYRVAGVRARALYANVEALAHFRAALALGHPDADSLHVAIGDLETLAGSYGAALASYETAAAHATAEHIPSIEHRIALLHLRRGEWERADAVLASVLDQLADDDRARALADRSLAAHRAGRPDDAVAYATEALALAEHAGDRPALAQVHNILGMLASDDDRAVVHLRQSLELAAEADDLVAEIAASNNLALALARTGATDEAIELTGAALDSCIRLGDRHREAALRNNRADLLHRTGRKDESMAELKRAVAIFAEIGEAGKLEPEIWKLSDW